MKKGIRGRGYVYKQLRHLWSNENVLRFREEELGHRLSDLESEYRNATHKCPECGEPMIDMGLVQATKAERYKGLEDSPRDVSCGTCLSYLWMQRPRVDSKIN